ncbi:MAG: chitobiase/beta-hexosaminidase C-terminal domain-containing protein [Candidatus Omnitrophica bacterium]|nr:chitobiase/beta-hexosaminidase C-terminal domain-containing protein [Candidatus Omnitrophota bacterium]
MNYKKILFAFLITILTAGILLSSFHSTGQFLGIKTVYAAIEVLDFTSFIESDPAGNVAITPGCVSFSALETRNTNAYVYKDLGGSGDFKYSFDTHLSASDNWSGPLVVWGASDTPDATFIGWNQGIYLRYYKGDSDIQLDFEELNEGAFTGHWQTSLSLGARYYVDVQRNGATVTVDIYSDDLRTNLVVGHAATVTVREALPYVYGLSARATGSTGKRMTGDVCHLTTQTTDTTPPQINIEGVTHNDIVKTDVTPIITITDEHLVSQSITLNNESFISGTTIAAEGQYALQVNAEDTAGNSSNELINFTIDKTAPIIISSYPSNGGFAPTQGSDVSLSIVFSDNFAGVDLGKTRLFDEQSNDITAQAQITENNAVLLLATSSLTSNTDYAFTLYLEDNIGNSDSYPINFTLDPSIPEITVTPQGGRYYSLVTARMECSEEASIYYSTDGYPPIEGAANTIQVQGAVAEATISSNTKLQFFAVDLAGNISKIYPDPAAEETYIFASLIKSVGSQRFWQMPKCMK